MSTENLQTQFSKISLREKNMEEKRKKLPIYRRREQLLKVITDHNILIITGDITTGKTTQIPQYLHEAGYTKIGCTLPRDFAARSIATRVSKEMGVELGHQVGYSTLHDDCTSEEQTVIEYMTDKKLLQEFIHDDERKKLSSYSVLIVDEAHQRTVSTDLLLVLLKDVVESRSDLKLIISGASDKYAEKLSYYFNLAPIFEIHVYEYQYQYPVEIFHVEGLGPDVLIPATLKIIQIHETEPTGDILVFLPGQEEIELVEVILKHKQKGYGKLVICPIFANMPSELPVEMFEPTPAGARKVVLATDIAEAYLASDGFRYVIDTGLCKMKAYNPMTEMPSLLFCPISKASAIQRADQAGRAGPGKCFRLYPASNYDNYMVADTVPEVKLVDLSHAVLTLKCLGLKHLMCFDFLEWPQTGRLLKAVDLLYALDAVDDVGKITDTGRKMAEFPLVPMLSKMILASDKYKCSAEIITIAAMLSVGNSVFYSTIVERIPADNARMKFYAGNVGDHIALLKVYNSWAANNFSTHWCHDNYIQVNSMKRARVIRDRLEGLLERVDIGLTSNSNNLEAIKKAITSGFFPHFAKLEKAGYYRTVLNPQTVFLHPSPSLPKALSKCIIFHEMVSDKGHLRQITEVKPEWLVEIAPHYYKYKDLEIVGVKEIPRGKWNAAMY